MYSIHSIYMKFLFAKVFRGQSLLETAVFRMPVTTETESFESVDVSVGIKPQLLEKGHQ